MNTNRWDRIDPVLDSVLKLPEEKWKSYVTSVCSGDKDLLNKVLELLDAIKDSKETHFLEKASSDNSALIHNLSVDNNASNFIGKRIGAFEITEQIGLGGMAVVFKAKRIDGQFKQQVAIKLVRRGIQATEILQRFEMEKQILADLSHPNIARIYDGGITGDGNPYLIMEFIDGLPIDQYCNNNKSSITERLSLFQDVCRAVEYAHQNLIIHRDLKAQNIYVTNEGLVKILDFGIAKLLDAELTQRDLVKTLPGQQFWTPHYASPEQILGESITTTSDVYSLGVLLHKLLTGVYPYDFKGKSITQIKSIITNKPPDTLRKSLNRIPSIAAGAKLRHSTENEFLKILGSDLEAITAKALSRDVSERYSSVIKLSDDLNNYKNNSPVTAQVDSILYKFKKFNKRHNRVIGSIFFILLVIVSMAVYYTHQLTQQKEQALYEAEKAAAVSMLLKNILVQSSPYGSYNVDISLEQILANGQQQINNNLKSQPLLQAEMMGVLGEIYTDLGLYTKAKPLLIKGLQVQIDAGRTDPALNALNLHRLGYLLFREGYFEESEIKYRQAEKLLLNLNKSKSVQLSSLHNAMGMLFAETGDRKKAIEFYENSLALSSNNNALNRAMTLGNLGIVYQELNEFDKALTLLHRELELRKELLDSATPYLANTYNNLAFTYQRQGNLQKADSLHHLALTIRENILPPNHPHIASSLIRYGLLKVYEGKFLESEEMFERALKILKEILPDDHWQVLSGEGSLALARGLQGHLSENIPILEEIYTQYKKQFGSTDWRTKEAYKALQTLLFHKQQIFQSKNNQRRIKSKVEKTE